MEQIISKWEEILQTVKDEHELTDVSFNTWLKPHGSIFRKRWYSLHPCTGWTDGA